MAWAGTPEKIVADKGTEYYTDFQAMLSNLGTKQRLIPIEAAWQHGMVERHGAVLADVIYATITEMKVVGTREMTDVVMHACMAKNRRPGRTGYSPRTLVFGIDERLVSSGLNHYLEEPDDASIAATASDPLILRSLSMRKTAMKALIDLDHSEKWKDAIKFPSRKAECAAFLPGHQVFFWKKQTVAGNLKGRRARTTERWYGPGVVIGHEWDLHAQRDSYWVSYGGKCFLVAGTHMRHAEFEECLSHEKFIEELKTVQEQAGQTNFEYFDARHAQPPPEPLITEEDFGTEEGKAMAQKLSKELQKESQALYPQVSRAPHVESGGSTSSTAPAPGEVHTGQPRSFGPVSPENQRDNEPYHTYQVSGRYSAYPSGHPANHQKIYSLRNQQNVLVVDVVASECYFLKWKIFKKMQKKGK
jgi:hypothetical protein